MAYDATTLFRNLARFNQRSSHDLFELLSDLSEEALSKDRRSWFGSLLGILNHLLVTNIYWLRRYRALSPDSPVLQDEALSPAGLEPNAKLFRELAPLRDLQSRIDTIICRWFDEFPAHRLEEKFEYRDSSGVDYSATAARAFEFLFLHQTHHRGEIAQILDSIGIYNNPLSNITYLEG